VCFSNKHASVGDKIASHRIGVDKSAYHHLSQNATEGARFEEYSFTFKEKFSPLARTRACRSHTRDKLAIANRQSQNVVFRPFLRAFSEKRAKSQ
jgi:hypothetical protein